MYVFLSDLRPRSVNAKYSEKYKQRVQLAFKMQYADAGQLSGDLYGIVYYFHSVPTQLDADNISKPIWDALSDVAYTDDKKVKLRSAGIFDLQSEPIEILDLSGMPDSVFGRFLEMINSKEHILYVEVGELAYSLFRFGCGRANED